MTDLLPCPSCGFLVIDEGYGSFDICRFCGWEDDGVQLANPLSGGGANRESLAEAQQKALLQFPLSLNESLGFKRSEKWRPLNQTEIEQFQATLKSSPWPFHAVCIESEAYWSAPNP
ncbi:CPCC family cysteine-rich protein [Geothrix alkalitolerans]|uniref:CPCC family cysteine-rich protein n=1 Tax=Geothrix alkalitolerans TaxID=2922724 RepID=UPI003B847920